tara:strand:- start:195 stop:473 length:279 start_codon:yes stop_codon:yes gene_type:complete
MVHKKDFVTRLSDIWNEEIENKNKLFNELFKSQTELLLMILDVTKLPDSKALRVTDPLRVEIYDDDGDYCYTIDCNSHFDLNQKIKKELGKE